ncbi:hypothetical protein [Roseobacter weihaiensis]|uniref:hypothetical protein n=1 Tax=Roseobacter weihaiensis TaxID=2763262 RepID=UPI001D0B3305|nr:hypothetical protein [Roseobacter sp. H9]
METFDGHRTINTVEELRQVFQAVLAHYDRCGVTDMARHCVEARFKDANTVAATHETRLISRNVITQAPFAVFSILKFNGECWQVSHSSYAIGDRADHNSALLSAGT